MGIEEEFVDTFDVDTGKNEHKNSESGKKKERKINREAATKAREEQRVLDNKYGETHGKSYLVEGNVGYTTTFGAPGTGDLPTEHLFEDNKALEFTKDWESNPETVKKLKEQYPNLTDGEITERLQRQLLAPTRDFKKGEQQGDEHHGRFNPGEHDIALAEGEKGGAIEVHERGHAGFDLERGSHAKDILGDLNLNDAFGNKSSDATEYVNSPREIGGFLQQARFDAGIKPGQEITEDQVKEIVNKYGEKNLLLQAVGQGKKFKELTRVFNEVALQTSKEDDGTRTA